MERCLCKVKWISGTLEGIVMENTVIYNAYVGKVVSPYGCGGKFIVLSLK